MLKISKFFCHFYNSTFDLGNTYPSGGYSKDLAKRRAKTEEMLGDLKKDLWIDRGTRAVFIDFTVYNPNINLFCVIKLVAEMPATGGVIASSSFSTVNLLRLKGTYSTVWFKTFHQFFYNKISSFFTPKILLPQCPTQFRIPSFFRSKIFAFFHNIFYTNFVPFLIPKVLIFYTKSFSFFTLKVLLFYTKILLFYTTF